MKVESITDDLLLMNSDSYLIAKEIGCSDITVRLVQRNKLGKRQTALCEAIKKALTYRSEQNKAFIEHCKGLK